MVQPRAQPSKLLNASYAPKVSFGDFVEWVDKHGGEGDVHSGLRSLIFVSPDSDKMWLHVGKLYTNSKFDFVKFVKTSC